MKQAAIGDTVRVHYRGTLDDGSEFDNSNARDPIEFTLGTGHIIPGLETELVGMAIGDEKTVKIEPDDAYGPADPKLVHVVQRGRIPAEINLQIGTVLQASDKTGERVRLHVVQFDDDKVTLDGNHPLAGKALTFELRLVDVVAATD